MSSTWLAHGRALLVGAAVAMLVAVSAISVAEARSDDPGARASAAKPAAKKKTAKKKTVCATSKKATAKKKSTGKKKSTAKKATATAAATTPAAKKKAAAKRKAAAKKKEAAKKKSTSACAKKKVTKKPASSPTVPGGTVGAQSGGATPAAPGTTTTPPNPDPQPQPQPKTPAFSLKVNFQTATTVTPAGYLVDYGQAFSAARGFGWISAATGVPLDLVGNGRESGAIADKLLDSYMSMQLLPGKPGVDTPGSWKAAVPNGNYAVTVAAGDQLYFNSHHVLNVEGQPAVDFTPSAGERSRTAVVDVTVNDGFLDVDANGGTNTKIDYITIAGLSSSAPQVTSVAPANGAAGVCRDTTITVQLSSGITPATANSAGLRVLTAGGTQISGAYLPSIGSSSVTFVPSALLGANATYTVQTTNLLTDANGNACRPSTTTFTTGANLCDQQAGLGLKITTPEDGLGLGSRLVYSTVGLQQRTTNDRSFAVTNPASAPVTVSGLGLSGADADQFILCPNQVSSFVLAPGASAVVCVRYRPTVDVLVSGTQVDHAALTITASDEGSPHVVTLGALDAKGYEGTNEPSLQAIFSALGYDDDAAIINTPILAALGPYSTAVGDEVLSAYWKARDASQPVTMLPLAHYSGLNAGGDSAQFGWFAKGSGSNHFLYRFRGGNAMPTLPNGYGYNQMLLPTPSSSTVTFDPGGSFGLVEDGGTSSDDTRNFGEDWHNWRFFPARDLNGTLIPGTYLAAQDIGSPVQNHAKNWDYQDAVFLLRNVEPESGASGQPTPGEVDKNLASFTVGAGGIAGTGFTSTQGALEPAKISITGGQLKITSSNDSNTSHTNALQLGVNAGTAFRVNARLVGPFTNINAGAEQQGIYWGPDGNNYIKAELEHDGSGGRALTIWLEKNGSGNIVRSIALPGGDASTVDLRIQVEASPQNDSAPYATVSYAINGGAFVSLSTANVVLPASNWVTANTPAGIVVSHQEGGSPFVGSFASFQIIRSYY